MATTYDGERCEKCGRRVALTIRGLCGYCAHATTSNSDRARAQLESEGAIGREVSWTDAELRRLTFYRQVWGSSAVETR